MDAILKRVVSLRKSKGISHEAMAVNLDLSQAAYSKIEKGETKLSLERLYQIADILGASIEELMGFKNSYSQEINGNENFTAIAHQEVENLYQENKGISEKLIKHLEELVESKNQIIQVLEEKLQKASKE